MQSRPDTLTIDQQRNACIHAALFIPEKFQNHISNIYNCLYKTTIRKSARPYIHTRTVQNNSIQSLDWTGLTGLPLKLKIQSYNGILVPTCTFHIYMWDKISMPNNMVNLVYQ